MTKLSIIIPTMQKDLEVLNKLLLELVDDNSIAEIIIIDNSTKGFSYDSEKVRVIVPKKNLFVNPAWNLGIQEARNEYIGILNDDLLLPKNYCSEVLNFIAKTENVGLVGIDSKLISNTQKEFFETYPEEKKLGFEKFNSSYETWYWGSAIFGKKENFYEIPDNLKIWCGDNYLQKMNIDNGKQNYQVVNVEIKHLSSLTVNSSKKIKRILQNDIRNYSKIDKRYKDHDFYRSYLAGSLFSITNSKNIKHKVITILGIKIKVKYKLQDKKRFRVCRK